MTAQQKKQEKAKNNNNEFNFDVEVGKILNLMINSLYTNKDIEIGRAHV